MVHFHRCALVSFVGMLTTGLFFLPQLQKGLLSSAPALTAKSFRMFLGSMPNLTNDYKLEVEAGHSLATHHTEPSSTRDLVAIMVVGQSRRMLEDIERTRLAFELSPRIRQHLRSRNVSTSFKSHVLHALEPLRRAGLVPEYLLCIDMGTIKKSQLPPEVVQSWTFRADSQVKRITTCLRRVLERESKKNISYSFFVRLRPDFLLLSDLPDPRDPRRGPGCMLTRFCMEMRLDIS
eukprot:s6638_g3.t1